MRLFVAVELPSSVIAAAAAVSEQLRERVVRVAPGARLAWVPADRMHITLRFLGRVPDEQATAIARVLARPFDVPAFTVRLGHVGTFPPRGAPRTVWIALDDGGDTCRRVEAEVSSRLDLLGLARDPRPFTPHLTLARARTPAGLRASSFTDIAVSPGGGPIDAITLFESRLSSRGPTYTALQRTSLRTG
jgi:2'-5' RNA ligase